MARVWRAGASRRSPARHGRSVHLSGLALVMLEGALWATVGVPSPIMPHDPTIPGELHGFARAAVAGPALAVVALLAGGARSVVPREGRVPRFLLFGLCCAVFQIGLFRSLALAGVTGTGS